MLGSELQDATSFGSTSCFLNPKTLSLGFRVLGFVLRVEDYSGSVLG